MYEKLEIDFAGRKLTLETGRLAKQAHGSVLATYGDTVVLATAVSQYGHTLQNISSGRWQWAHGSRRRL